MLNYIEQIQREVTSWEGISAAPHRFGGVEFNLGKAEIGHIHLSGVTDIPFPMNLRNQLLAEGLVSKHHVLPDSGWVTFRVRSEVDIPRVLWLLKLSYLRYVLKQRNRGKVEADKNADSAHRELTELNLSDGLKSAFEKIVGSFRKGSLVEQ
jgi:hypothetical protein